MVMLVSLVSQIQYFNLMMICRMQKNIFIIIMYWEYTYNKSKKVQVKKKNDYTCKIKVFNVSQKFVYWYEKNYVSVVFNCCF